MNLPNLARMIGNQYEGELAILYARLLRYRRMTKNKSDTLWNFAINVPARSMRVCVCGGGGGGAWGPHAL